jgi:hypothetical protein
VGVRLPTAIAFRLVRHLLVVASAVVLIAIAGGGCTQPCTNAGGINGVVVGFPVVLYVRTGSVSVEVCDDTACARTTKELGKLPGLAGPEGRSVTATFSDLKRDFEPGSVEVRVELRDGSGAKVAAGEQRVELRRSYPNGRDCDGDGFVSGSMQIEATDAL